MLDQPHNYHVHVSSTGTGPAIDMSGCNCATCRVPPPITLTTTSKQPWQGSGLYGEPVYVGVQEETAKLVQPVSDRAEAPVTEEKQVKEDFLRAAKDAIERRNRTSSLVESIAAGIDEALLRQEIIEDKVDAILADHEELDTLKAKMAGWTPPVVGDQVWSRSTHEGPFYVVRTVVMTITARAVDRDPGAQNKFTGVDGCVVRDGAGRFHTIPVGDLSHEPPARQPIPGRVYAAMIAAGVLTVIAGQLIGLFLVR